MERHLVLADKELVLQVGKERRGLVGKERPHLGLEDKQPEVQDLGDRGRNLQVLAGTQVQVDGESALEGIHPGRCWRTVVAPAASC